MPSPDTSYTLSTPVAFFIFRRPTTTQRVFEAIARAKPPLLLVIADGPRNPEEVTLCAETRAIINQIDWACEVKTNFADTNLGLKKRFSSGLDWVFEQVEEAIILEDDCVPDDTFFRFCQELLEKYRNEPRVFHIGGDCFVGAATESYYFTRFAHIWGWATWRRAWKLYDVEMMRWRDAAFRQEFLRQFDDALEKRFWRWTLDSVSQGKINTWDFQWAFAGLSHQCLAITPSTNLVSNIGFDGNATNTLDAQNALANLRTQAIEFPLRHPFHLAPAPELDARTAQVIFRAPPAHRRIWNAVKSRLLTR
jgi:hypothetical protein